MSYLYLLVDDAGHGFKIGVSIDPVQRMATLPEKIDAEKSFQIKCGEKNSYRVEKTLHLLFRNHHLTSKKRGDGYTEWFSMDCFDAVQDFIRSQRDLLGWTHFEPIPKPTVRHNSVHRTDEEKASRKAIIAEKKKAEFIKYLELNRNAIIAGINWISSIREKNILLGKYIGRDGNIYLAIDGLGMEGGFLEAQALCLYNYRFLKNGQYYGGMFIFKGYKFFNDIESGYYGYVGVGNFDNSYIRNDEFIQPLVQMIENIPFISKPQLSDVLLLNLLLDQPDGDGCYE